MTYRALYRTYRPTDFNEVAGQKHITITLQNALSNNKVAHAYLFSGPRGTGKTSIAKIFAKAVNCEHAPVANPCNQCEHCLGIQDGSISDVIEIDAASNNGVDEIRELRDKVKYLPGYVKYKVYIIDEVHMLSTGAFNALLKTLEEPPQHVIFILCTTEPQKIPLTIHSRCQRFDFKAITTADITTKLLEIIDKEEIHIDSDALEQIAVFAEGGLRDALSLLDQVHAYSPEYIRLDDVNQICGAVSLEKQLLMLQAIIEMDSTKAIEAMNDLIVEGKEVHKIAFNLLDLLRNVLMFKNVGITENSSSMFGNEQFIQLAKMVSNRRIFFFLEVLTKAINEIKWSNSPKLFLELAFIKMTDSEATSDAKIMENLDQIETRVRELETREPKIVQVVATEESQTAIPEVRIDKEESEEQVLSFDLDETNSIEPPLSEKQTVLDDAEDISATYQIEFVEYVLNNGDRDDKVYLLSNWNRLSKMNASGTNAQFAARFESGTVKASSKNKIIVTFSSASVCNQMMKPSVKAIVRESLNKAFGRDIDYIALPEDVFAAIADEFASLWRIGKRKIKLSPIVCPELRDVTKDVSEEPVEKEQKVVQDAVNIFGDFVKIKK